MQLYVENDNREVTIQVVEGGKCTHFLPTEKNIGGIPIFQDRSKKIVPRIIEADKDIKKLIEKYSVDIILGCSEKFMEQMVYYSKKNEIDVQYETTTKQRMMHYAQFGCEPSILIVTIK